MKQHGVFTALLVTPVSLTDISVGAQWKLTELSSSLRSAPFKHTQPIPRLCRLPAAPAL